MFMVQTTHSKSGLKRPERPCDSCRRRKSRCVFSDNDTLCFLCRFHNYECVFSDSPAPIRKRNRKSSPDIGTEGSQTPPPVPSIQSMSSVMSLTNMTADVKVPPPERSTTPPKRQRLSRSSSRKGPGGQPPVGVAAAAAGAAGAAAALDGERTPTASTSSPPVEQAIAAPIPVAATPDSPFPDYDFMPQTLLKDTLGLQCRRYISYLGTSAEHDPVLMQHYTFDGRDRAQLPSTGVDSEIKRQIRRVRHDDGEPVLTSQSTSFVVFECENFFASRVDISTGRDDTLGGNLQEVRKIQEVVGKFGRKLVDLYFRIVHPCMPILHKEEFMEKYYRNPYELSPSLLAGLYVFAINWWMHDPDLVPFPKLAQTSLETLAQTNLYREIDRPTLSTVQAGLLLLQHQTFRKQVARPCHSSAMLGEVVSIAHEVGLHLDPTKWQVPDWERGLRKRLAWGLFMQDKWMALTFGRPSHINRLNWTVSDLEDADFHDDDTISAEEDEFYPRSTDLSPVNPVAGKAMFVQHVALSKILSDICDQFHSPVNRAYPAPGMPGGEDQSDDAKIKFYLSKARPLQIRLKEWFENLPDILRMEYLQRGELSCNGNLHLGYHAAQITLFRPILQILSKVDYSNSESLREIYSLVYRSALAEFVAAVEFVNALKPQHLQTFWFAASKNNLASIVTFGLILLLLSSNEADRALCTEKLSEFHWTLRVNVRGAEFFQHAILWLEELKGLLKPELDKRTKSGRSVSAASDDQSGPSPRTMGSAMFPGMTPMSSAATPAPNSSLSYEIKMEHPPQPSMASPLPGMPSNGTYPFNPEDMFFSNMVSPSQPPPQAMHHAPPAPGERDDMDFFTHLGMMSHSWNDMNDSAQ
ncbi:fungal-specific transcription factor domain-containing protein [Dipodascopsis tothii]|uniref:fungal-specific transcription factor domain-containing protein n=1 Tax=Dipodascopsis tothii TaxID=44089 RepID=UPI0034CD939B